MEYKLFLDDERYPLTPDWFVARTSYDAIFAVSTWGLPKEIAFDHDLGGEDTAMVFLRWLEEQLLDGVLDMPEGGIVYSVHSANPIGAWDIKRFVDSLNKYF